MTTVKVLVLQDEDSSLTEIREILSVIREVEIIYETTRATDAVRAIDYMTPDVIITDMHFKSGITGPEVLKALRAGDFEGEIVVVSSLVTEELKAEATSAGVPYYVKRPFVSEHLVRILTRVFERVKTRDKPPIDKLTQKKLETLFGAFGIPPHIKGYWYLREGVKIAIKTPDSINKITKALYPQIGVRYITSPSKVERAIRHAIEVTWANGDIEKVNYSIGAKAFYKTEKPTNGEFIALLADKILLSGV